METWIEIFCLIVFHVFYKRKTQSSYTKIATFIVCWLHLLSWYSFHNSSILWFWCALKWQKLYHTNKHILSSTILFWLQFHFVTSRFIDSFENICIVFAYYESISRKPCIVLIVRYLIESCTCPINLRLLYVSIISLVYPKYCALISSCFLS